ncbi:MAG: phage tail tape measure protein [Actinomycetota bacterium]
MGQHIEEIRILGDNASAEAALNQTASTAKRTAATVGSASGRMRDASGRFVSGGLAPASKAAQTWGQKLAASGKTLSKVGTGMQSFGRKATTWVTLPVLAAGAASVKMAADFDTSFRTLSAVTQAPAREIAKLKVLAKELGEKTIFSANEAAQAILELAKAGVSTKDIMGGALEQTLSLAAAGNIDLATAAKIASNAMNTFGIKGKDSQIAADALAGAANASSSDVADLALALSQAGTGAKAAGLSIQETTAILAAFSDAGIRGSDAGTSLKTFLLSLVPSTTKAREAMKKLNLDFVDAEGNIKPITEVADELQRELGHLTQAEQQLALKTIFGTDAFRAANIIMNEGADGLREYISETSRAGAASEVAEKRMGGIAGRIEKLKGAFETAGLQLGEALIPVLEDVIPVIESMLETWSSLSPETRELAAKMLLLAAALGPIAGLAGGLLRTAGALAQIAAASKLLGASGAGAGAAGAGAGAGAAGGWIALFAGGAVAAAVGWMERAKLGTEGMAEGFYQAASAGNVLGGFLQGGISGLVDRVLDPTKYRVAADEATFLNDQLNPLLATYHEMGGTLTETEGAQIAAAVSAGRYSQALQMAKVKILEAQGAVQGWAGWLNKADGFTSDQKKSLAGMIGKVHQYGKGLNENQRFALKSALATSQYGRALKILRPALASARKEQERTAKSIHETAKEHRKVAVATERAKNQAVRSASQTGKAWEEAGRKIKNLPKKVVIEAKSADQATQKVKKTGQEVEGLNRKKGTPKVDVDDSQARNAISGITQLLNNIQDEDVFVNVIRRGEALGGIGLASGGVRAAATGFIARQPTLVGEGQYATRFGKGAEAIVPLDSRGIRILSKAIEAAGGGGRGGDTIIHVHPSPGMDEAALAREVSRRLARGAVVSRRGG